MRLRGLGHPKRFGWLEEGGDGGVGAGLGVGYGFVGEVALVGVDAFGCAGVLFEGGVGIGGQLEDVGLGGVGEGECAGVGDGGGHVGDAVVDYAVDLVRGIGVGGGAGGFDAAALIDRDVYDDSAFFHFGDHAGGDDFGGGGTGDEDAANDEVGLADGAGDIVGVGGEGVDAAGEDVVELAEAVEVQVDQGDAGTHAEGDFSGVGPDDAAADDAYGAGRGAGYAAEKDAAAAVGLGEVFGADLDG